MKCSGCGAETVDRVKAWSTVRASKSGRVLILTMGLYECQSCGAKFRVMVGKKRMSIGDAVNAIRKLESQLAEAKKEKVELEDRVKALEGERARQLFSKSSIPLGRKSLFLLGIIPFPLNLKY